MDKDERQSRAFRLSLPNGRFLADVVAGSMTSSMHFRADQEVKAHRTKKLISQTVRVADTTTAACRKIRKQIHLKKKQLENIKYLSIYLYIYSRNIKNK